MDLTRRGLFKIIGATVVFSAVRGNIFAKELATQSASKIELYNVAGQTIFPTTFYGSGGMMAEARVYPMLRMNKIMYIYCHRVTLADVIQKNISLSNSELVEAKAKKEFMQVWSSAPRVEGSLDGGAMPEPGCIAECTIG
jgi:hypothetical protein